MSRALVIVFMCLSALTALAQAEYSESGTNYVLCKNMKAVRSIRVDSDPTDKKCVVYYTKLGVDKGVGRGQNISSCNQIVDNIKDNLEKAKWKCKEFGNYDMTSSSHKNE